MAKWMVQDLWQSGWFNIYERVDGSKKVGAKQKSAPRPPPKGGGEGERAFLLRAPLF